MEENAKINIETRPNYDLLFQVLNAWRATFGDPTETRNKLSKINNKSIFFYEIAKIVSDPETKVDSRLACNIFSVIINLRNISQTKENYIMENEKCEYKKKQKNNKLRKVRLHKKSHVYTVFQGIYCIIMRNATIYFNKKGINVLPYKYKYILQDITSTEYILYDYSRIDYDRTNYNKKWEWDEIQAIIDNNFATNTATKTINIS